MKSIEERCIEIKYKTYDIHNRITAGDISFYEAFDIFCDMMAISAEIKIAIAELEREPAIKRIFRNYKNEFKKINFSKKFKFSDLNKNSFLLALSLWSREQKAWNDLKEATSILDNRSDLLVWKILVMAIGKDFNELEEKDKNILSNFCLLELETIYTFIENPDMERTTNCPILIPFFQTILENNTDDVSVLMNQLISKIQEHQQTRKRTNSLS